MPARANIPPSHEFPVAQMVDDARLASGQIVNLGDVQMLDVLEKINAQQIKDLAHLSNTLDELRKPMKSFFKRNIDNKGRLVRGLISLALFLGAAFIFQTSIVAAVALFASGIFVLFETLRGWCALRACGIKTKL